MTYSLFVDDEREPKTEAPVGGWIVARSMDIAIVTIIHQGWPEYISMDHDLGEDQKTGYDFVKWLVDCHMQKPFDFPEFNYHTANPVGRDNMKSYVENYLKTITRSNEVAI